MFLHLGHVVSQQQHAKGGPIVYQHAAIAVQHAAARSNDGNFADAVAFRESGVLIGVNDLKFPEAQQQHADHAHDDIRSHREPRLRQTIVIPKPVRHENPAREESSQDFMFRPDTPDGLASRKIYSLGFEFASSYAGVRLKMFRRKFPRIWATKKSSGAPAKTPD